jgi:hypothetical protein
MTYRVLALPLAAAVAIAAAPALAQQPRTPVSAAADKSAGEPSFRDPKTGQVWTPENVGEDGKPVTPQDRAFDPGGQAVANQQVYVQQARVRAVGSVPITASPTVPLIDLDSPSLRVQPGGRWRVVMYLQNNSANALAASLSCRFTNEGKLVLSSYITVPPVAGGQRVGLSLAGPPSYIYLDNVTCQVVSPI